jgi:hypothetical protein
VGYAPVNSPSSHALPHIKPGVLNPASDFQSNDDNAFKSKMNIIYAKDYKASTDIRIIMKGIKSLGN